MSDYTTLIKEKLMNEYGLTKQQVNSKTVDCFAEFLKDNSDFYQAYKESGIDTVVDDMSKRLKYMNNLYNDLLCKFESIENKLRRMDDISEKLEKLLDDTKDFKTGTEELSERSKDAVIMYKEILKATKSVFPNTYGYEKDAIKASSYVSYAALSGNKIDELLMQESSGSNDDEIKKKDNAISYEDLIKTKRKYK